MPASSALLVTCHSPLLLGVHGLELSFLYGSEVRRISLPAGTVVDTLLPQSLPALQDPPEAAREALANPMGAPPLSRILHHGESIAILVNDVRRRLVSQLPEAFARKCHLHPTSDPQTAVASELRRLGGDPRIACIPSAGMTLPVPVAELRFVA